MRSIGNVLLFPAFLISGWAVMPAQGALVVGYTFMESGPDNNVPQFTLTNDSDVFGITNMTLTIGDTSRNWDRSLEISQSGGITASLVTPDGNGNGGVRSDQIEWDFTGFNPALFFEFDGDVDTDSSDSIENFRTVLYSNGATPNAVLSVTFSNGTILSQTFPDFGGSSVLLTQSQSAAVPEPTSLALFGLAAGAVALRRRLPKRRVLSAGR